MNPRISGALVALGPEVAILGSLAVPLLYTLFHPDAELPLPEKLQTMQLGGMFAISLVGTGISALGITKWVGYQMKHDPNKVERLLASPLFKIF